MDWNKKVKSAVKIHLFGRSIISNDNKKLNENTLKYSRSPSNNSSNVIEALQSILNKRFWLKHNFKRYYVRDSKSKLSFLWNCFLTIL